MIREIVEETIRVHPRDCLFERDAVERATAIAHFNLYRCHSKDDVVDTIREAIRRVELVCPREGVDRTEMRP